MGMPRREWTAMAREVRVSFFEDIGEWSPIEGVLGVDIKG